MTGVFDHAELALGEFWFDETAEDADVVENKTSALEFEQSSKFIEFGLTVSKSSFFAKKSNELSSSESIL